MEEPPGLRRTHRLILGSQDPRPAQAESAQTTNAKQCATAEVRDGAVAREV